MSQVNVKMIRPTATSERVGSLDFLRGVAILGILFINIENFAYPDSWSPWKYGFETEADRAARFWVYFLTQGKFYNMFTLLFGVGFYMFLERLECKNLGLTAMDIYARRLLWLFIIGVIHAYFIWSGDVLYHYAICGLLLFPFRSMSKKWLLFSALILALLQMNKTHDRTKQRAESYTNYLELKDLPKDTLTEKESKRVNYWDQKLTQKSADTSYVEAPKRTYWKGLAETYKSAIVHKGMFYYKGGIFSTLMMMIIGILLYRMGIFHDYRSIRFYWGLSIGLLILGLGINYLRYDHWTYDYTQPILNVWEAWMYAFCKELLSLAYLLMLNGLYQKYYSNKRLIISSIGRMALSNYLFQSIIQGLIFYGYGLALFNQFSRVQLLMIIPIIWITQLGMSWAWSRRFEMGPIESFWRRMTYFSFKPISIDQPKSESA